MSSTATVQHRTFRIHGRVQGVFFRQSSQAEARRLGLHGYARNNDDGTVTIEAEGPAEALAALEAWCQHGPPAARVERVEVVADEVRGYTEFEVRR
ncbi:acylphosphatase [Hymenobacter weizhouensis]|uniref:acylphosphatase n=1 Tax=Hymenobacter sp. YIM 151500-1 TaxID=2987689 RepID=UPI002227AFEB|nr:acylphosphatase [Hymenobacter sp. YIM 151500-1]UYZ61473.1 acylphosphatase [Hymenobacter sp. YIM 151500-1]